MNNEFKIVSAENYFLEVIKESSEKHRIKLEDEDALYLTHILVKYMRSANFHRPIQEDSTTPPPTTFAEIYLTALNSEPARKKELLQIVGDKTLYIVGFFPESVSTKIIKEPYYMQIGSAAYKNLHGISRGNSLSQLYKRFSERFYQLAKILKGTHR